MERQVAYLQGEMEALRQGVFHLFGCLEGSGDGWLYGCDDSKLEGCDDGRREGRDDGRLDGCDDGWQECCDDGRPCGEVTYRYFCSSY
jgi:hypothetical protein